MDNTFAKRFKKERNRLGLTQDELANKLSVSKRTISNWETGQTKNFLEKLVKEGMDIGYLITGIPTPPECLKILRQSAIHGNGKSERISRDLKIIAINEYLDIIKQNLEGLR